MVSPWTLFYFTIAATVGILIFDLYLLIFNQHMTLSRALTRLPWYIQTLVAALICFLIFHFWGS